MERGLEWMTRENVEEGTNIVPGLSCWAAVEKAVQIKPKPFHFVVCFCGEQRRGAVEMVTSDGERTQRRGR
jgi:hypothetical protein